MNRMNITLLCVVMLLAGWLARGILDIHAVDGEVERRLTACITWGISSGLLSPGGDTGYDSGEAWRTLR